MQKPLNVGSCASCTALYIPFLNLINYARNFEKLALCFLSMFSLCLTSILLGSFGACLP